MLARSNVNQNQSSPNSEKQTRSMLDPRELATQRSSPQATTKVPIQRRRRILGIMSTLLLIILIFAAVRLPAVANILSGEQVSSNDELLVRIGNQQVVTLDLRQSLPISPDLLGANVFPQSGC